MRGGEDAAGGMRPEYFDRRLDPVAPSTEPDIHQAQGRLPRRRKFDRFIGRRSDAGDFEAGIDQGGFDLVGDQEIVLDEQNALGRCARRGRGPALSACAKRRRVAREGGLRPDRAREARQLSPA